MTGKKRWIFVELVLLAVGVLISCQSKSTPTLAELSQPGIRVGITDDTCPTVQVKVGQEINWTNQGKQEHIVRAKSIEGESAFETGIIKPGDSFSVTLMQPDIYEYDCSEDGSLTGTIKVEP
jgi:hypothetical protein